MNGKLLMLFKKHHNYQHHLGKSMKLEDWGETFTKEDFDNYRATAHAWNADDGLPHDTARVRPGNTSAVNAGAHAITSAGPKPIDEVATFEKGARRDATLFKELKEQRNWHQWWLETKATAQAQDVAEALDPNYQPKNDPEKLVFLEKQKCMRVCAVLEFVL